MEKPIRDAILYNAASDMMNGIFAGNEMHPETLRAILLDLTLIIQDLSDRLDST